MLGSGDLAAFLELTARDPVTNVFAEYRARTTTLDPRWLGGEMWGRFDEKGRLTAACHVGANLVPVECDAAAACRVRRAGARPDPHHLHHRRAPPGGRELLDGGRRRLGATPASSAGASRTS